MLPDHDRRATPRVPFQAKVFLDAMGRRIDCRGSNLSAGGMLIFPPAKAKVGLAVRVHFILPGTRDVNTLGATLVRTGDMGGTYCWGIRFTTVSTDVGQRIDSFVATRLAALKGGSSAASTVSMASTAGAVAETPDAMGGKLFWAKRLRNISGRQAQVEQRGAFGSSARVGAETEPSGLAGYGQRDNERRRPKSNKRVGRETLRWGMIPDTALPRTPVETSLVDELLDEDTAALQQRLKDIYKDAAAESKRQGSQKGAPKKGKGK